jgi:hypothetical protein
LQFDLPNEPKAVSAAAFARLPIRERSTLLHER